MASKGFRLQTAGQSVYFQGDMKLVIVYIVQKHIHTGKVIGGVVDFLPKETVFDNMSIKLLFSLAAATNRNRRLDRKFCLSTFACGLPALQ